MAHTLGPWRVMDRLKVVTDDTVIAVVTYLPCVGGDNDMAAQRAADQEMANARLIAAAPDLLAALKDARREVIALGTPWQEKVAKIDAAIAKAEGK